MKKITFLLFLITLSLLSPLNHVFAQSNSLTVSPSIIRLDLAEDKPEITQTYTNTSNKQITLIFSASDVKELEDGYKLSFLEGKDAENYKYALSSWINFTQASITIPPHTSGQVTVLIDKEKLTPGGHYGSILAKVEEPEDNGTIRVVSILSSLVFVRTNTGRENEIATVENFAPVRETIETPDSFLLRFNNIGDVDLIPYGMVEVYDIFGRKIAKGILNESSLSTLPESLRRYDISVKPLIGLTLPGKYTAVLTLHYGKKNIYVYKKTTYFAQGSIPLIPTVSIGILLILIGWRLRRRSIQMHRAQHVSE